MTKGLYTIIPIATAIGLSLFYKKQWKDIFHWQWLIVGFLTLIFTMPTLYSYYVQFDMHPEKVIFGKTGVSGISFFFWDSQWGRFTNTGPIQGAGDPTFFLHTLLWAFAPWAFLAYFALYNKTKKLIKSTNKRENYTYFGFIVIFLIFSASKFQLPHYLVPIFPMLAILTTDTLISFGKNQKFLKTFNYIHLLSIILIFLIVPLLQVVFFDHAPTADTIIFLAFCIALIVFIYVGQNNIMKKIIFPVALSVLSVNYYLSRNFYPELLRYQSESEAAFYIKKHQLPVNDVVTYDNNQIIMDVYLHHLVPQYLIDFPNQEVLQNKFVFISKRGLEALDKGNISWELLETFDDFHVTTLNPEFLNKQTREGTLEKYYLVKTGIQK